MANIIKEFVCPVNPPLVLFPFFLYNLEYGKHICMGF